MHDILLLLPMIALLFKKQIVERFGNEKCDATERKIELLEEKMKLENSSIPTKNLNERIQKLNDKIKELDNQIMLNKDNIDKQSKYYQEFKEYKEKKIIDELENEKLNDDEEKEETYFNIEKINNLVKENTIFNAFIIIMIIILISIVFYLFINNLFDFGKKRKLKIDKINVKYDNILDEIKKSKVKNSIKFKKGSLFSFLDKK